LLLLMILIAQFSSSAITSFDDPEMESLLGSNATATAFVKGEQIRLCVTNGGRDLTLKAGWKKPRVPAKDFSFSTATLEAGKSSPPKFGRSWREVKVLSAIESTSLIRDAADHLVPGKPGGGIQAHYAFGDAVLYRDADRKIAVRSGESPLTELTIERRYNRKELASAMAAALETHLKERYPGATTAVLTMGSDSQSRFALLDFAQRRVVILYLPQNRTSVRFSQIGSGLSTFSSFILIDHAWAFLKNPVSSTARTLNQLTQWPLTLLSHRLGATGKTIPPVTNAPGMNLALWERWLDGHTHTRPEQGSLRLLIDGEGFYPLLERRVSEAQSNIDFHVCIFDSDDVAVDFADRLKQRSTNVEVNVVFDRMLTRGAAGSPPGTPMREGFVQPSSIRSYLEDSSKVHVRPQPNPGFSADHSKIFLVDGRYAYVGGMNLGREYRYEWHDLMAELQGPIVASFQRQFDKKWAQVGLWGDCGLAAETFCRKKSVTEPEPTDSDPISVRRLYTKTFHHQIRKAELAAIKRASSYIYAENPYFFSNEFLVALTRARRRGVDVRVIMPDENDLGPAHKSNLVVANYLLTEGVRVYFFPGMTHVKALVVDGWACFGSANFDALSLRLNREADLATSDSGFVKTLRDELFEADFARSRELKEALAVDYSDYLTDAMLAPF